MPLFFQDKPVDQFIYKSGDEKYNSSSIDNMHHFQIEAFRSVGVVLPKEIHLTKLRIKKEPRY